MAVILWIINKNGQEGGKDREDDGQHDQEAKQPCDECSSRLLLKNDRLLRLHDLGELVVDVIDHNQDGRLAR